MNDRYLRLTSCALLMFLIVGLTPISTQALSTSESSSASSSTFTSTSSTIVALNRVHSGVAQSDPLNATLTNQQLASSSGNGPWTFGGYVASTHFSQTSNHTWEYTIDGSQRKASVNFYEDSNGLHIGVQSIPLTGVSNDTYTGFYAVSPPLNASLFHAVISSPYTGLSSGDLQVGLYVQATTGNINYVTCGVETGRNGTHWQIVHATGITQATNFEYLWVDNSAHQPSTRDCTIITNGDNYLAVFLDHSLVYENNGLSLNIQEPVLASVELESTYYEQMLNGTWRDFYATSGSNITVTDVPPGSLTAAILDQSGNVLASSPIENHSATINVANFRLPIIGALVAYGSNERIIASTANGTSLMAGDVYSGKSTSILSSALILFFTPPLLYFLTLPVTVAVVAALVVYGFARRNSGRRT